MTKNSNQGAPAPWQYFSHDFLHRILTVINILQTGPRNYRVFQTEQTTRGPQAEGCMRGVKSDNSECRGLYIYRMAKTTQSSPAILDYRRLPG